MRDQHERTRAEAREALKKVQAELASEFGEGVVDVVAADVSSEEGREAVVSRASDLFDGVLDVLVNNVGTNDRKPAAEVTAASYDGLVATNQTSAFFLCTQCLPLLRRSARASVVNVTSLAGVRSSGTGVVYAMTKAAMNHMTEALACEWAGYGVRVNCVCPWMVRTPMLDAVLAKDPTALDPAKAATPLGRLGEPADTAGAVGDAAARQTLKSRSKPLPTHPRMKYFRKGDPRC